MESCCQNCIGRSGCKPLAIDAVWHVVYAISRKTPPASGNLIQGLRRDDDAGWSGESDAPKPNPSPNLTTSGLLRSKTVLEVNMGDTSVQAICQGALNRS